MAESFVQLPNDGSGKKVRSFENTVNSELVHSQAFTLVDESGNIVGSVSSGGLFSLNVNDQASDLRYGGGKTTSAVTISSTGDNTVITPGAGNAIRLFWIALSSPEANTAEVVATVKFGSSSYYKWSMGAPGAFSHWEIVDGGVDEPLVVNLSSAQTVHVNITYQEV